VGHCDLESYLSRPAGGTPAMVTIRVTYSTVRTGKSSIYIIFRAISIIVLCA